MENGEFDLAAVGLIIGHMVEFAGKSSPLILSSDSSLQQRCNLITSTKTIAGGVVGWTWLVLLLALGS